MSPVDILAPNLTRFPKFAQASPLVCEIEAGDILFLPSFWWHEVVISEFNAALLPLICIPGAILP